MTWREESAWSLHHYFIIKMHYYILNLSRRGLVRKSQWLLRSWRWVEVRIFAWAYGKAAEQYWIVFDDLIDNFCVKCRESLVQIWNSLSKSAEQLLVFWIRSNIYIHIRTSAFSYIKIVWRSWIVLS